MSNHYRKMKTHFRSSNWTRHFVENKGKMDQWSGSLPLLYQNKPHVLDLFFGQIQKPITDMPLRQISMIAVQKKSDLLKCNYQIQTFGDFQVEK